MEALREFGQRGDVREFATRLWEAHIVHGLVVDVDDLWLDGWVAPSRLSRREFERWDQDMAEIIEYGWCDPRWLRDPSWTALMSGAAHWTGSGVISDFSAFPIDPSFRFAAWERLAKRRGNGGDPFFLRVLLRPNTGRLQEKPLLQELVTGAEFRVVFEARPVAQAFRRPTDRVSPLVGGVSVGSEGSAPGTLGGLLQSASGDRYALTCSHVVAAGCAVDQPSDRDNSAAATEIGRCVAATKLVPSAGKCNPYGPALQRVDAALIEIDPTVTSELELLNVGRLSGRLPMAALTQRMLVEVVGKRCGHRQLRLGGIGICQELMIDGQPTASAISPNLGG
jgi:hypothetical protein